MNCINHNDVVAVGACSKCSLGLCAECVNDVLRDEENKPICPKCMLEVVIEPQIAFVKAVMGKITQKRIIWSAILAAGAISIIFGFYNYGTSAGAGVYYILQGILIWSCAGFTDRVLAKENQSQEEAHYNAVARHRIVSGDGTYMLVSWTLQILKWLARGAFFPVVYLIFMLTGADKLKKELTELQEARDTLVSRMQAGN